ncbi:MAG TPA: pyrroline-5-carboxylate reductase [Bacteroidales bacterium]|nr:pyrroline-5-carboxylate reductase [Bacteroidales bacterium]
MNNDNIAVLGCGNIGMSVLEGILRQNKIEPGKIIATKRNLASLNSLSVSGVKITTDNTLAVRDSNFIIIAVKSYNFSGVLNEIRNDLDPARHIIISVTTGIPISRIKEETYSDIPVFRAMPNISASVNTSVTCLSHNGENAEVVARVQSLFDNIGTTMIIDEGLMESATILGSCGVAYVLRFIRAMIQGGIQIGFDARTASAIVNQTVKGAAELLIEGKQHPEKEIDRVTTPKGCTIVGLNEMEHNGFSSSLIKGIVASFEKIER